MRETKSTRLRTDWGCGESDQGVIKKAMEEKINERVKKMDREC
jgi:hypothetical protein